MKSSVHGSKPSDFYCRTPCSFQLPGMMFSPGKLIVPSSKRSLKMRSARCSQTSPCACSSRTRRIYNCKYTLLYRDMQNRYIIYSRLRDFLTCSCTESIQLLINLCSCKYVFMQPKVHFISLFVYYSLEFESNICLSLRTEQHHTVL